MIANLFIISLFARMGKLRHRATSQLLKVTERDAEPCSLAPRNCFWVLAISFWPLSLQTHAASRGGWYYTSEMLLKR